MEFEYRIWDTNNYQRRDVLRIGYPLDSHVTFEEDGTPVYDRAVSSAPLRKLYKKLFSDGILPNPSTNMQVSAGNGMNVVVQPGFAICNGCLKLEETQRTLTVQASSNYYDRIDTVVLRLNDNDSERICDFYVLEGVPASSPVRPTLTRNESVWELGLADLYITKGTADISNQRITDTRYETARCGILSSISQFDTTELYNQIQADLKSFREEEQADFLSWFENIKNQLSEDAAGNLQLQINEHQEKIDEHEEKINEHDEKILATETLIRSDLHEFSPNTTYEAGEYCVKDNILYKFLDDKVKGEWSESIAREVDIISELNNNWKYVGSISVSDTNKSLACSWREEFPGIKEIMVRCALAEFPWMSITIPCPYERMQRHSTSLYYSEDYFQCIAIEFNQQGIGVHEAWTTGNSNGQTLGPADFKADIYYR